MGISQRTNGNGSNILLLSTVCKKSFTLVCFPTGNINLHNSKQQKKEKKT